MSGKAAAFGGRMMNSVADQVLKQFAANFAAQVRRDCAAARRRGRAGGGRRCAGRPTAACAPPPTPAPPPAPS